MINYSENYWLKNVHIPAVLIPGRNYPQTSEGLSLVSVEIIDGKISQIVEASTEEIGLGKRILLPAFIDIHTHLDKGHIWQRSPNPEGTFAAAITTVVRDATPFWEAQDLYRRMEFGLRCSYAHGTKAIRTHLGTVGLQADISLDVFTSLQREWQEKILLQGVCLVSVDYFQTSQGVKLADKMAAIKGILGAVAYINDNIESQLDAIFTLAKERGLDLDFHVDENGDVDSICLQKIAEAAMRHDFQGKILCGHCCSLAVQALEVANTTIQMVKEAGIAVVSLPMCNLYLQDRKPGETPRWRGVTLVKELHAAGVKVAFASDNCRDPFYGFGDHDMLEVFRESVRIAHLDTPYGDWIKCVTHLPAVMMGLTGEITEGSEADLILFKGRYFSELLSRPECDRLVLRGGKPIDTTLPAYEELDDLL